MRTAGDFYRLTAEQLLELEGYGEVSVNRLLAAIEASKERRSAACCSRSASRASGFVTGRNLAQRFRSIDALLAATPEQIAETPGHRPDRGRS